MNDLIDRQAAIDALWKALYEYEDKTEKQFQESDGLDVGDWIQHRIFVQNMSDIDRQTIINLPPAQLGTNLAEVGTDTISRQAAIDRIRGTGYVDQIKENVIMILMGLPPAQPKTCEDAVSRKAVIDAIDEWKKACADSGHKETVSDIKLIRKDFSELPPVTPKQRTGKWIYHIDDLFPAESTQECDQCHAEQSLTCDDNYCPNCGAKMEGVNI